MDGQLMLVLAVAVSAALASPLGGVVAILLNPTTLLLSVFAALTALWTILDREAGPIEPGLEPTRQTG